MLVLKFAVMAIIMIHVKDEYNSPFQINYKLVTFGINSNVDTNNSMNINNKKYAPIQKILEEI